VTTLPLKARAYWGLVVGTGLACCALFFRHEHLTTDFFTAWILLVSIDFLAEIYEVELIPRRGTSVAVAVGSAAVFIGGVPLGIATVFLGSLAAEIVLRWNKLSQGWRRFVTYVGFNLAQLVVSVTAAGLVFQASGGNPPPYAVWTEFIPPVLAFLTYVIVNTILVGGIIHLTQGRRLVYVLRFDLRHLHIQLLTLGVLALLMAVVYPAAPWYLLLVASPLVIVQVSIRSYARLRQQAKDAFQKISHIVGERDPYTGTHSADVAELAVKLARALRLHDEVVEQIEAAAQVHDLGKIAVPDSILLKPGKLTEEEWAVIKRHPVTSAELLQGLEIYEGITDIVRHEHEHWNGGGYPDGLAGEKIPVGSRILAVADVWNALITDRPYRPAYSAEQGRKILKETAGTVLDPKLVDLFLTIVE